MGWRMVPLQPSVLNTDLITIAQFSPFGMKSALINPQRCFMHYFEGGRGKVVGCERVYPVSNFGVSLFHN